MDLGLRGKTALITGSTAGIGLAIAKALAREGADVVINGRTEARVADALGRVREHAKGAVSGIAADAGTRMGADQLIARHPEVDVLVNNLGIFEPKPFDQIPDEDWLRLFEVNVLSGVRMTRAYLPGMLKRNWGRVVFISSESAFQIPVEMVHYGMTKSAQVAIARGIAETTAGTGVTVNSVLPGPTKSEGVETFVDQLSGGKPFAEFEREFFANIRPSSLLKRFETVEEIADVVAFVCSPLASSINGAAVRAEGGVIRSAF
jgi:NAD(P)-dependent dehydrogenase (short-subunit alcohol dehydrogenase family)